MVELKLGVSSLLLLAHALSLDAVVAALSRAGSQPIVLGSQPIVVGKAATGAVAVPLAPAIVPVGAGVMGEPIPIIKNVAGEGGLGVVHMVVEVLCRLLLHSMPLSGAGVAAGVGVSGTSATILSLPSQSTSNPNVTCIDVEEATPANLLSKPPILARYGTLHVGSVGDCVCACVLCCGALSSLHPR